MISALFRIITLLGSIASFVIPMILMWLAFTNGAQLMADWVEPILDRDVPEGVGINISSLASHVNLSVINAVIPLAEMLFTVKAGLSLWIGIIAFRAFIKFVQMLSAGASAAGAVKGVKGNIGAAS